MRLAQLFVCLGSLALWDRRTVVSVTVAVTVRRAYSTVCSIRSAVPTAAWSDFAPWPAPGSACTSATTCRWSPVRPGEPADDRPAPRCARRGRAAKAAGRSCRRTAPRPHPSLTSSPTSAHGLPLARSALSARLPDERLAVEVHGPAQSGLIGRRLARFDQAARRAEVVDVLQDEPGLDAGHVEGVEPGRQ